MSAFSKDFTIDPKRLRVLRECGERPPELGCLLPHIAAIAADHDVADAGAAGAPFQDQCADARSGGGLDRGADDY